MNEQKLKELEEVVIAVALKIAKREEGALIVIGDAPHTPLIDQQVPPFPAIKNPKLLESLALIDGAVIIDKNGIVRAYGVMIKSKATLKNFGTRHSAAISAATGDNIVIVISEEDKKVRIMKKGKMIMQLDPKTKDIEKSIPQAVNILESVGAGALGTLGATLLAPTLGIALLPGIVIFGSAYYVAKKVTGNFGKKKE